MKIKDTSKQLVVITTSKMIKAVVVLGFAAVAFGK
jgi:hypothetical protein